MHEHKDLSLRMLVPTVVSAFAVLSILTACGKSPLINLQSPNGNLPGVPANKAGAGSSGKGATNGVLPEQGIRMLFVNESTKQVLTLSTLSNGVEAGRSIVMVENEAPAATITPALGNVGDITAPHLASVLGADHARILFMGRSMSGNNTTGALKLYAGDYSLSNGTAAVTSLGASAPINASSLNAANSMGLAPRNYGSSSLGHYLVVPGVGGLRVLDSVSLKDLGGLGLSSANTFWPEIDEGSKTISVVIGNLNRFQVVIFRLNLGATVSLGAKLASSDSSRIALSPIADGKAGYYWGETNSVQGSSIVLVHMNASGNLERATFSAPNQSARVFPQVGVLNVDGVDQFAVAFESIAGGGAAGYDVVAGVAAVILSGGRAVTLSIANYQSDILIYMQTAGWKERAFNISALASSYDRSTVTLQARTQFGNQPFQFDGSVIFEVASQNCSQMDVLRLESSAR